MIASSPGSPAAPTAPATPAVSVHRLVKRFGAVRALDDISLQIGRGQFVTVLGPSGCGKTTLLRAIAGFAEPDAGTIAIDGVVMDGLPPYRRPTAMVFQHYALFPHLSVAENVAFGLRERARGDRLPSVDIAERVEGALAMVELAGFGRRRIGALSGGQQQRVALARSLVLEPAVLLLDEPLGALDVLLRRQMQGMLKHLQRQTGITFLAVTHDQEEALTMSDRIVVMQAGRIEQEGTPEEVYARPQTRFVAEFMGEGRRNLFPIRRFSGNDIILAGLRIPLPRDIALPDGDGALWAMLPPPLLQLERSDGAVIPTEACYWESAVRDVAYRGATRSVTLDMPDGTRAIADLAMGGQPLCTGDAVSARFDPADLVFVPESAPRLDPGRERRAAP